MSGLARWWGPCRHRHPWDERYRCPRRGPFGVCIEHRLERMRWEWRCGTVDVSLDLSNINRPYLLIDNEQRPPSFVSFGFGNGNSDPAFTVTWNRKDNR